MPINRPDRKELVTSVREMLEDHLVPALEDKALLYQCRVSVNILKIVERELAQGSAMLDGERQRLAELLGETGDLDELNASLIRRIQAGEFDGAQPALLDHFLQTTLDKIAIDNPGYSTFQEYQREGQLKNY